MARSRAIVEREKLVTYRYVASSKGQLLRGKIKAPSEIAAERIIIARGYNPMEVKVAPSAFSLEEALPSLFRVKPREVIVFSRQLATLIKSGISLLPALEILGGQLGGGRAFRSIMGSIVNDLRSGNSFSQAIFKHPQAFSEIYCRTIAVGEESGSLEAILRRMADYMERQASVGQRVGKAFTYPIMVLGVGVVVVFVLMTVVMPKLLGMFQSMNVELPLPTRILIGLTNFLSANQLYLIIAAVTLAALTLWLTQQPRGRKVLDRIKLLAPVIGPPALMLELGRICRTMSVLVAAGVKFQDIMEILPKCTSNRVFRDALNQVAERFLMGQGLSGPMSDIKIFPPLLVQMVAVGEESNTLDFTMGVVADFYESAADEKTSAMIELLGPMSTIVMALGVGFLAIAIIMPIYALTGAFG